MNEVEKRAEAPRVELVSQRAPATGGRGQEIVPGSANGPRSQGDWDRMRARTRGARRSRRRRGPRRLDRRALFAHDPELNRAELDQVSLAERPRLPRKEALAIDECAPRAIEIQKRQARGRAFELGLVRSHLARRGAFLRSEVDPGRAGQAAAKHVCPCANGKDPADLLAAYDFEPPAVHARLRQELPPSRLTVVEKRAGFVPARSGRHPSRGRHLSRPSR